MRQRNFSQCDNLNVSLGLAPWLRSGASGCFSTCSFLYRARKAYHWYFAKETGQNGVYVCLIATEMVRN
jgi:hypothetical protein